MAYETVGYRIQKIQNIKKRTSKKYIFLFRETSRLWHKCMKKCEFETVNEVDIDKSLSLQRKHWNTANTVAFTPPGVLYYHTRVNTFVETILPVVKFSQ